MRSQDLSAYTVGPKSGAISSHRLTNRELMIWYEVGHDGSVRVKARDYRSSQERNGDPSKERWERVFLHLPLGELMANLEADGLNATGGQLRLGGVEATAVGSHHLHHHPINAALRHLPPHTLALPPPRRLPLWKRDLGSELSGGKDRSGVLTPHAPCGLRRGEIDRAESPKLPWRCWKKK